MLKIKKYIYVLIFICNLIFASNFVLANETINSFEYLKIEIDNNIEFNISQSSAFNIQSFKLKSFFFPQTFKEAQYLNLFNSTNNNYLILNDSNILNLEYNYENKNLKLNNKINNKFIIESVVNRPKIFNKVKYPLTNILDENKKYLKFINLIDISPEIRNQASKLAEGEDDVFIIASKIAKWVQKDINYDLSTLTQLPNQKSSEVFSSKRGVCKEVSNLYVSMIRSLGIPARIVTGYAYTNSQDIYNLIGSNWGGHAWVEVLIGNKWVPFDLTYNQYGFVDSSHIILDKYVEIRNSGIAINATGRGFNIIKGSLKFNNSFKIIDKRKTIFNQGYLIEVFGDTKIGFKSEGRIGVKIKNNDNFYKIIFLRLSKITEVENLDRINRMEILKPNEEKTIYFKYKVKNDLNKGYRYTFPFIIYNDYFEKNFSVNVAEKNKNLNYSNLILNEKIKTKIYSKNKLEFECNYNFNKIKNKIICSVLNKNNYILRNVSICLLNSELKNDCRKINFNLNEKKIIFFKSSNLKDIIKYSFDNIIDTINITAKIPKLKLEKKLEKNIFYLNLVIGNFSQNTIVNIFLNDKLIKSISSNNSQLKFELKKKENYFKLETKIFNKSLNLYQFLIKVKSEDLTFVNLGRKELIETKINNEIVIENSNKDNFIISFLKKMILGFKDYFRL